jgi:hypothetical protein
MAQLAEAHIHNSDGINCGLIAVVRVVAQIRTKFGITARSADPFAARLEQQADKLLAGSNVDIRELRGAFATSAFQKHPVYKVLREAHEHDGLLDASELLLLYASHADKTMQLDTVLSTTSVCSACTSTNANNTSFEEPLTLDMLAKFGENNGFRVTSQARGNCPSCNGDGTLVILEAIRPSRLLLLQVAAVDGIPSLEYLLLPGQEPLSRIGGVVHSPKHWRSLHNMDDNLALCGSHGIEDKLVEKNGAFKLRHADLATLVFTRPTARTTVPITAAPTAAAAPAPDAATPAPAAAASVPTESNAASRRAAARAAATTAATITTPRTTAPTAAAARETPRTATTSTPTSSASATSATRAAPRTVPAASSATAATARFTPQAAPTTTAPTPDTSGVTLFARWNKRQQLTDADIKRVTGALSVSRPSNSAARYCFLRMPTSEHVQHWHNSAATVCGVRVLLDRQQQRDRPHSRGAPYAPKPPLTTPGIRTYAEATRAHNKSQQPMQQQQQQLQQQQQQQQQHDHWAQQIARFASEVQFDEQPPTNPSLDDIVFSAVRTALSVLLNASPSNASALPVFRQGGPTAAHQ